MSKVILIDSSGLFVPTVKVVGRMRLQQKTFGKKMLILPPFVMYFNSLMSSLSKIGVDSDDIVIVAEEGRSWRKDYASFYKGNREALRKKDVFIDWPTEFKNLNYLHAQLKNATNWYFVRHENLESDDVIAIACRYFKDKEIVIVTGDKDLFQLAYYPNVKIFTLNKKLNGSKGMYEEVKNPLKIIADKCRIGDEGDNIIPDPNEDEHDAELRRILINLLELPPDIEKKGIDAINKELEYSKSLHLECLPKINFLPNIKEKFLKIYKKEKVITYEYCLELLEKRTKQKKEAEKEKRRLKKEAKLNDARHEENIGGSN